MNTTIEKGTARAKIIEVASELFYSNGYNATGVQEIINKANVAKGTFYTHFESKDELGLIYLQERHNREYATLKAHLDRLKEPVDKYVGIIRFMKKLLKESCYRGCAFTKMIAEIPDYKNPVHKEARGHYESVRKVVREIVHTLIKSSPKYRGLDEKEVADDFIVLVMGAVTNAEVYKETWPFDRAEKAALRLINKK